MSTHAEDTQSVSPRNCLTPEEIFNHCLDVDEGIASPHVTQHILSCRICSAAYEEMCQVNDDLSVLQQRDAASPIPSRPSEIGGYLITSAIARGGMGSVWKGTDTVLERSVAIKVVRSDLSYQAEYVRRFLSEAKIVAGLDHPNIVKVYSAGQLDDGLYLCMEYIEGETFDKYVGENPDKIFPLFRQVLQALRYAHEQAIIHRDIKPSNIMVRSDDVAKALDFGLARPHRQETESIVTGGIVGTIAYLSPEVIRGEDASVQSDIYAAGLVLYELLSGGNPFIADSPLQTIERIKSESLDFEGPLKSHSSDLRAFLARMTAGEPSVRYATVSDALQDFDTLPECHGSGLDKKKTGKALAAARPLSRPILWLICALLIVAGLIGYTQFGNRESFAFDRVTLPYKSPDGTLAWVAVLPVRNETSQTDEDMHIKTGTDVLLSRINHVVIPLSIEIDETNRYMAGRDVMKSPTMDPILARDLSKQGYTAIMAVSVSEESGQLIITGKLYSSTGALIFSQVWRSAENGSETWRELHERAGTELARRLQEL